MDDNSLMAFGQYQGNKLANVPASYLLCIYDQEVYCNRKELKGYIEENMDILKKEAEPKIQ